MCNGQWLWVVVSIDMEELLMGDVIEHVFKSKKTTARARRMLLTCGAVVYFFILSWTVLMMKYMPPFKPME